MAVIEIGKNTFFTQFQVLPPLWNQLNQQNPRHALQKSEAHATPQI